MNREQRRRLSSTPSPRSVPVTVSREVPVSVIMGADGSRQVIQTDTDEPCFECPCCVLWVKTVDTLREAMAEHEVADHAGAEGVGVIPGTGAFGELRVTLPPSELFPGCLVCQLLAGVVDNG